MRSNRGFTLVELLVAMGIAGIMAAVAIPVFLESSARNAVWTASETMGSQIRQARLKAITRNTRFRVRFDCPAVGQFRVLVVTGDAAIDNAANRCTTSQQFDSGAFVVPPGVAYNAGGGVVPTLEVNGRGVYSSIGGAIPQVITVTNGVRQRNLTVSATGQITFAAF